MRFGIAGPAPRRRFRPAEAARRVEELGLESLFLGEHTHIPWSRESAYPLGELPRNYSIVACPLSAAEFEELEDAGVDRCLRWVDSMHADDFEAQMQPFLTAIEEYGWDRAEAMPTA